MRHLPTSYGDERFQLEDVDDVIGIELNVLLPDSNKACEKRSLNCAPSGVQDDNEDGVVKGKRCNCESRGVTTKYSAKKVYIIIIIMLFHYCSRILGLT